MAIALNGGHVARALDFYKTEGKYFIIGGTEPWVNDSGQVDETSPAPPSIDEFKLIDVVGLRKVEKSYLVVPVTDEQISDENIDLGFIIEYRNQKWKRVEESITTTVSSSGVSQGSTTIPVNSVSGFKIGDKVRIDGLYEGKITLISTNSITLDTPAPSRISSNSIVLGGAMVEDAKYVYVACTLYSNSFPVDISYRQIGLCTRVTPDVDDTLLSAAYAVGGSNEYTSLGVLEVLDNRQPTHRDIDMSEELSLVIEF